MAVVFSFKTKTERGSVVTKKDEGTLGGLAEGEVVARSGDGKESVLAFNKEALGLEVTDGGTRLPWVSVGRRESRDGFAPWDWLAVASHLGPGVPSEGRLGLHACTLPRVQASGDVFEHPDNGIHHVCHEEVGHVGCREDVGRWGMVEHALREMLHHVRISDEVQVEPLQASLWDGSHDRGIPDERHMAEAVHGVSAHAVGLARGMVLEKPVAAEGREVLLIPTDVLREEDDDATIEARVLRHVLPLCEGGDDGLRDEGELVSPSGSAWVHGVLRPLV